MKLPPLPALLLLVSLDCAHAQVRLNELMASNARAFPDVTDFEDYPDWIELKNTGATAASLNGYFLSDDPGNPFKWPVPDGAAVPAGGFQLFMADGNDAAPGQSFPRGYWPFRNFTTEKYHTNFSLGSGGESLTLTQAAGLATVTLVHAAVPVPAAAAIWKYKDDGSDQSTQWRARNFDDAAWPSGPSRIGYGNAPATTVGFGPNASSKYPTTYFRHSFQVADPTVFHGLTLGLLVDDGAVVYLNGAEIVRRNMPVGEPGYKTTASFAVTGATSTFYPYTVPASALVAGTNVLAVEVHQAILSSGDIDLDLSLVGTSHTSATTVDTVTYTTQVPDVSYGRDPAVPATWKQFAHATPGAENSGAVVDNVRVTGTPVTTAFAGGLFTTNQTVTLASTGGVIHYTFDSTTPTAASPAYTAPLTLSATTILRARCFEEGKAPGPVLTRSYLRDATNGTTPAVPYVSVVADPQTLFGNTIGIYANTHEPVSADYGLHDVYKSKDAPGNVEFFAPAGAAGFRANCGIRIGGENNWVHPQKALNIAMKSNYGDSEVKYDLFPGTHIPVHTSFTLREGGDNWTTDMLKDAVFPRLAIGYLKTDTADYRPSVVFINGAYYGVHDIRQRWDDNWFLQQYHIPAGKVDHLLYGHITSLAITLGVDKGDTADWLDLMNFLNTTGDADFNLAANWAYIESKIDMDSFMDWVISESWGNNISWQHNREFWKEKKAGAKWHFFLTDMDRTFGSPSAGILGSLLSSEDVLRRLKLNTGFKHRLAQRYAAHMAATFAPARVQSVIAEMDSGIAAEIPRHAARWAPNGTTVSARNAEIASMKAYATSREGNFYGEVATQFGMSAAVDLTLVSNTAGQGSFLVAGVPVGASTLKIFPNAPFELKAVAAPGYMFSSWTGATGGNSISVTVTAAKTITANFVPSGETILGGTLAANTTLPAGNYALTTDLIVPAGITLTISAGASMHLPAGRNIRVQGVMNVSGIAAQPVSFTGRNGDLWGGISFESPAAPSLLSHLVIRNATKCWFTFLYSSAITGLNATAVIEYLDLTDSASPVFFLGGSCTVRDSVIYQPYVGDSIHVKQGVAVVQRCTFPGNTAPDTDAIDFDGVHGGLVEDCKIYRFSGFNSDGIDIGEDCSDILIKGNLIYDSADKGVSVGQSSTVFLRKNLIAGCDLGVGIKDEGSFVDIDQTTIVDCRIGVDIYEKNFGAGGGSAHLTNTIISRSASTPLNVDSFSSATASYCLSDTLPIPGTNNIVADPRFVDPVVLNYQLQSGSPAIDAGDPAHAPDPDNTVADIGASYFYQSTDYPYTIGETVVINEVLANSGAASDWIELYNRTKTAIKIGGWFLSDDKSTPAKYRIPPGTVIPAGGYLTYDENTNFGAASVDVNKVTPFALSDTGESVYLTSAVNDELTDYQTKEDFGPSAEGETLGTYYKPDTDSYNFVAMKSATPGAANSGPRVGPIVISEIMYHPAIEGDAEYIELLNISPASVTLYDALKGKAWRLSDGIEYEFPSSTPVTIAAGERIILTKSLARFNAVFGASLPPGTRTFEWITGGLSNGGETLQLDRPGAVDALNIIQYIREDRVNYSDGMPWPTSADGTGPSLTKVSEKDYGNDYLNWLALPASPGAAAPGARFAAWAATQGVSGNGGDPDKDGVPNLMEYALGTDPLTSSPVRTPLFALGDHQTMISYEVDSAVPDLDYYLEASSDLSLWSLVDTVPTAMVNGRQTRHFIEATSGLPQRFYRMGVRAKP